MAVQQTDCYKVVTIGYLKSFIGSDIQNSSGAVVYVNTSQPDTYCPTYGELTGGTLIPNWSEGTTAKDDMDGITVSNPWYGSEPGSPQNYASNQLVDQKDLGLKYTRLDSFSISGANSDNLSECGGSVSMSYTYKHIRYTKSMDSSCSTATTSTTVDSPCNQISYSSSTFGSVSSCNTFNFDKNGSVSASSRSTTVTGSVSFRGSSSSSTVSFTQNALTGSYSTEVSTYTLTTSVTASRTTSETFGCDGGEYGASGTKYYDNYSRRKWVDSCGQDYPTLTADTKTGTGSTSLGSQSGSFSSVECDCESDYNTSATLTFSDGGYSDSVSFAQSCAACPDDDKCTGETRYRWVNDGDEYICDVDSHDKYHQEKKQKSTDSGSTWTDVDPKETRKGSLWESCSTDCGCPTECEIIGDKTIDSCGGGDVTYTIQTN